MANERVYVAYSFNVVYSFNVAYSCSGRTCRNLLQVHPPLSGQTEAVQEMHGHMHCRMALHCIGSYVNGF